ncbi:MAG: hypothetical protein AAF438_01505 [Pseudomonadota bacterium]
MAKTATEKMRDKKQSKKVVLDKDFAGIRAGQKMLVGTPQMMDAYIRDIPYGETRTIHRLRNELARQNSCDATCPVSTAIFIRIASEAALEAMAEGKPSDKVMPFWRLLTSEDKIAKKLDVDGDWIDTQRQLESAG